MTRVAVLGLGAMGSRMAARWLAAGHEVTVWNRGAAPAQALHAQGARVAASPRDAVRAAALVLAMVYDDAASRHVWLDADGGALAALPPDAVAVESSTLSPAWVQALGQAMQARGIAFVDGPVAGSRPQAAAGQLVFLAGGEAAAVQRAQPLLLQLGSAVHHVGPTGSGAWLKLAVNALFGTQVVAMAEQLALLHAAGLDPARALAALKALPVTSGAAAGAATLMLARDFTPQAPVALIAKDLSYAVQAALQVGSAAPVTAAVAQRFGEACAAGHGGDNLVAVARLYERPPAGRP